MQPVMFVKHIVTLHCEVVFCKHSQFCMLEATDYLRPVFGTMSEPVPNGAQSSLRLLCTH